MKKTRRTTMLLALIAVLALAVAALVACANMAVITFDGNGATGGTAPQAINTTMGSTVTLPECELTKTGHTFDGWKTGDTTYKAGDAFKVTAAETTFVAQWKAEQGEPDPDPETYALTYAAGDHGTGTAPAAVQKEAGAKFNLAAATLFTAETGYEFDGWSDGANSYAAGAEFTMPAKAVTMTAIWKKVPVLEEFFGECVLSAVNTSDQSPIPSVPSVTVVGLKIDFANKKAYYKLSDSTDWVDGKYFADSSTSKHKPDNYGSDALYIDIKIETIAYYALIKQDMTMLYLCNSDDATLEGGEFENVNTERTVTYIKPEGVTGTVPEVQTVQRGTKVTLASADTFTKANWTFYKWQVSTYDALRAPATQIDVNANTVITPIFSIQLNGSMGKILLLDNNTAEVPECDPGTYVISENIVTIDLEDGFIIIIEINETEKTYVALDGMQAYQATANDGTTKLTFDGKGGATLGTTAGTYELKNYGAVLELTFGGQKYTINNLDASKTDLGLKARITIDGTTYVFGEEATVTYELGTDVTGTVPAAQTVFKGEQITLPDGTGLTNSDKTFIGWTVKGGAETVLTGKYTVNGNVTLVSAWKDSTGGGDDPQPTATKLADFINCSYGSSTDPGSGYLEVSSYKWYKIEFLTATIGGTQCVAWKATQTKNGTAQTSSNFALLTTTDTNDKITDANVDIVLYYTKPSGQTCTVEFSVKNGKKTVTITNTTNNSKVIWTEITA